MTIAYQDCGQEEIKNGCNSGKACYHTVPSLDIWKLKESIQFGECLLPLSLEYSDIQKHRDEHI
jgi:hypothetical protein